MFEDPTNLLRTLREGGLLAFAVLVLVGGATRRWVFGWQLEEMRAQRDQLQKRVDQLEQRLADMTARRDEWRAAAWQMASGSSPRLPGGRARDGPRRFVALRRQAAPGGGASPPDARAAGHSGGIRRRAPAPGQARPG